MKVTKEQQEKNSVKLTITVDAETFEKGVQKAYLKNVKKIALPGFRKGKAPRKIIEQYYGAGVFFEDAINFVCPEAYEEALKETGVEAVSRPEIDVVEIESGKDFVFTATVTTKPEVELGDYNAISVKKVTYRTTQKEIEAEIKKVQEQNARIIPVEDRAVKEGDLTVIDFEGFTDGVAFDGGKGTDYSLEIGSGAFIPGFEDQLVGAEIGKEVKVNVTFPKDYHSEDLKGKKAMFKVTVKEIKEKQLPEINDDFVKDVSEFDTLDDYKKDIKEKIAKSNEQRGRQETENNVIDEVLKIATVEIPGCMIDTQLENIARDFDYRLSMQGLNLAKYLEMTGSNIDAFKEQFKEQAEKQVKTSLVLEAVAKAEKVKATEKDVEAEMKKVAESYNMELDKVKDLFKDEERKSLENEIITQKTVDLLVKNATKTK
ncbi:trigger factor [Qingrenia yutianensis]|uniref:Trigger factor n=1 Tax=Qingrenia yutianensis TaxID=2763676 RepID=A0A926FC17_9FIRM|nr:trigger factor [Qingrenia yutianensis]MBC8595555.1 trigger factor [Qingrenia yutianensis]